MIPSVSLLEGRNWEAGSSYRYDFNGKEGDDEVDGNGNQYDYGFRIYNSRLGRFISVDPLTKSYPWFTPYQFAGNNPIEYIDLDGLENTKPENPGDQTKAVPVKLSDEEIQAIINWVYELPSSTPTPVTDANKANISKVSWGETSGIYPQEENKFEPEKWDSKKVEELQKARAGIIEVSNRNAFHHTDSPDLENSLVKKLAVYHLTDNIPEADPKIKNDLEVKYFYLCKTATCETPSISDLYYDQEIVKSYGPFFAIGGGDAGSGEIYINFYKPVPKKTDDSTGTTDKTIKKN